MCRWHVAAVANRCKAQQSAMCSDAPLKDSCGPRLKSCSSPQQAGYSLSFLHWANTHAMNVEQLCPTQASAMCAVSWICRRWSRVLLLQQLLTDAMDLLDPTFVRVPKARRTRLMPVQYGPLPALSEYQRKLRVSGHPVTTSVCNTLAVPATSDCDCNSNVGNCSLATGFGHSWLRFVATLATFTPTLGHCTTPVTVQSLILPA